MCEVWISTHEVLCSMRKRVNLGTCEWQVGGSHRRRRLEEVLEPFATDVSGQPRGMAVWLRIVHPMYPEDGNT